MKVYIGKYRNWLGPYQVAEMLCFWAKPVKDEIGHEHKPEWVSKFGEWLATDKDGSDSKFAKFCEWVHSKKKRNVKIKIHNYDTWNMDSTLALIVLPMLKQLQNTKHGSAFVDSEDVPENLRAPEPPSEKNDYTDATVHERWEWVLNEIIWAFEQLQPECDWESQYFADNWRDTKPHSYDREGYEAHAARISNGLKLFGKYYRGLWD